MYLGNQPALSYTSFAKQDFTTSATTSYTLDNPVANENEIALFINFVRQEPGTAYTASGTSLTLTSATSASDDMYCVFLGKAVQTVNPPNGSVGTNQLVDGAVTSAKLASGTGGKVLQVVTATDDTARSTTSTSFVTASNTLSVSITPWSTSSKVLILVSSSGKCNGNSQGFFTIYRDGTTNLGEASNGFIRTTDGNVDVSVGLGINYLDSPSTTSATTYQVYMRASANTVFLQSNTCRGVITAMEIGV